MPSCPSAAQSAQVLSLALQRLRSMVHEIVGRINGHYGTLTHVPIHHLDRQLNFHELCALYAITDVALVTSLRDGMNLVSYEYVACQSDNAGEACLAVFSGCSAAEDLSKVLKGGQSNSAGIASQVQLGPASEGSACCAPVLLGACLSCLTTSMVLQIWGGTERPVGLGVRPYIGNCCFLLHVRTSQATSPPPPSP